MSTLPHGADETTRLVRDTPPSGPHRGIGAIADEVPRSVSVGEKYRLDVTLSILSFLGDIVDAQDSLVDHRLLAG